jgi:hypothetical protein
MKIIIAILLITASFNVASAQTNTLPTTGNVGVGTLSPATRIHIKGDGSNPGWLGLEKTTVSEETGIQFRKAGNTMFYLYSDDTNDGLKIQSTGVSGEHDGLPRFHIPFASKDLYMVQSGGSVGIGTSTPIAKLDVGSDISSGTLGTIFGRLPEGNGTGAGTFLGVRGYGTQPVNAKSFALEHSFYGTVNSSINFYRGGGITGGFISFNTDANTEQMRITPSGNVGIGTSAPDAKLAVNGTIHSKEVKVDLTGWPDYVFNSDYNLLSLEEIKTYIDKNKHLPEVPSAKEMEANGVQLGEMNMLLLKKIEELTLHVIELKKENEIQNKKLESLINKN